MRNKQAISSSPSKQFHATLPLQGAAKGHTKDTDTKVAFSVGVHKLNVM